MYIFAALVLDEQDDELPPPAPPPEMIASVPLGRMVGINGVSFVPSVRKGGMLSPELDGTGTGSGRDASEVLDKVLEKSRVRRSTPPSEARGVSM